MAGYPLPITGLSSDSNTPAPPAGAKMNALLKKKKIASAINEMLAPLTNHMAHPPSMPMPSPTKSR